jgi:hypothetical protein
MLTAEVYYRFEDRLESIGGYDHLGEWVSDGSRTVVHLNAYPVIRRTPKGVWIRDIGGDSRFICDNWTKRYALPTVEEAKRSFIKRKERQAGIYEARARTAREAITLANANRYRDFTKGMFAT